MSRRCRNLNGIGYSGNVAFLHSHQLLNSNGITQKLGGFELGVMLPQLESGEFFNDPTVVSSILLLFVLEIAGPGRDIATPYLGEPSPKPNVLIITNPIDNSEPSSYYYYYSFLAVITGSMNRALCLIEGEALYWRLCSFHSARHNCC